VTSSSWLKSIAGLSLGLVLAGSLFGQKCPTTGSEIDCATVSGNLTLISGPDPLMLAGFAFTAVVALPGSNQPFATGSATYSGVPLQLGTTSAPGIVLSCTAVIEILTSSSMDEFNVQSCTGLPLGGTLSAMVNFAGGTLPDPIPLLINTSITSGSTVTYNITGSTPTVLGIASGGTIGSVCVVSCKMETTSPASIPPFNLSVGGGSMSTPVTVSVGSAVLAYAVVPSVTSPAGGTWLTVSAPGGQTGGATGTFMVTATPGSLGMGTYTGTVKVYTLASDSPVSLPVTLNLSAASYTLMTTPSSLTFNSVTDVPVPTQSLSVTTNPTMSVSYTAAVAPGASWLSVSPASGTTGGSPLTVTANPAGLSGGKYTGTIVITQSGASNSPLSVPVTLNVTTITPSPSSLTFNFTTGGTAPPPQSLIMMSTSGMPNVTYAASAVVTTPTGGTWLSVSPTSGTTNTTMLSVTATPGSLSAGTYTGNIVITPTGASPGASIMVPVTFNITSAPTLSVTPSMLTFAGQTGGSNPGSQSLMVSGSPGSLSFTATAAVTTPPGGSWLSVTPTSGSTPATLTVSANISGLSTGSYSGTVTVSATGATPVTIPVTLTLSTQPQFTATPTSVSFTYTVGGTLPAAQNVMLGSTGSAISFTAAGAMPWVGVTPTIGTTPATLSITANPAGLAPGSYSSMVTVTSSGAGNSPFQIPVMLTVTGATMLTVSPTSLAFSADLGGTTPSPQSLMVSLGALVVPFTAAATTTSGGTWLSVMPTSGNTPATLMVSVNPAGLAAGTYTGMVNLTSTSTTGTTVVPVTLTVVGITVTPPTLTFNYATGSPAPPPQSVTVALSNGATTAFTATAATAPPGGSWLSVMPTSGSTPTALSISANPTGLANGTYTGTITIAAMGFPSQSVSVTLNITTPKATIQITGTTSFGLANTSPPQTSTLSIAVSDKSAKAFTVTLANPPAKWLTVSPLSGTTPATLTLTVNPAGLAPGTYETTLTIAVPGTETGSTTVTISLNVTGANLTVTPTMLSFTYQPGQAPPPAQTLMITSPTGTVNLATTTSNVNWVHVTQATSTPATVQVTLVPGLLAPGTYSGEIFFTGVGSPGPSLAVAVMVTINPLPTLTVTPTSLTFAYTNGGAPPTPQSLSIATGGVPLIYDVTGPSWLSITAVPNGSAGVEIVAGTTPGTVLVTPVVGLLAGTYNGFILVAGTGTTNGTISVPVTLTVTGSPTFTATPSTLTFSVPAGGPAPASQTVSLNDGNAQVGFTATTTATWLTVTPTTGTTPATLTVSINPAGLANGTLTGDITVTTAAGAVQTVAVTLTVGTGSSTPTITSVQNAGSFASASNGTSAGTANVAPGLIVAIFGSGLGPQTGVSASLTGGSVGTSLGGVQVMFDSNPAPLLYVGAGQINAIVPYEVMGQATTVLTVSYGGETSAATTLNVAPAAPGVFTVGSTGSGQGAILNQDGSANSSSNPAAAGTIVSLFGTGGGQTSTPSTDGEIAADTTNILALTATATVGGQNATMQYAGWAPTLVTGVFQVNVMIPSGTPSGPANVVLQIGTAQSQTVTVAVQ